jgi:hypothetical protein
MSYLRRFQHCERSTFAPGHCVHHLAAAVHAVAAGIVPRVPRLACHAIGHNLSIAYLNAAQLLQKLRQVRLPDGRDH